MYCKIITVEFHESRSIAGMTLLQIPFSSGTQFRESSVEDVRDSIGVTTREIKEDAGVRNRQ